MNVNKGGVEKEKIDQENHHLGKLRFSVIEANLTHDLGTFSQMDPYVTLKWKNKHFKTNVLKGAGKNPHWNQAFEFELDLKHFKESNIWVDVMD